ncbi:hypothetical protein FHR83_006800 [Actinoplanes campanulatus]|uniref:Uncharacterized protein n=1 Tax=Actinoplanes campanulatus TaxID=113559 RepID=A0A7W5ANI5_9ACTN|nr:hypothetical protein [Actinoplanes campanulatus]MBB3099094.1 hypothetical protein [Actinoplanes campanulatus]GGN39081.1 hypothetical protein GCM10010109_66590 [Actinoplanes campanulatus]GID40250.1 hypothetical protein Aca09nite_67560 [Actinoplanes campanulatus]
MRVDRSDDPSLDLWEQHYAAEDDSVTCTNQRCGHPVWRHYGSVPGLDRVCSCGCTAWGKTPDAVLAWIEGKNGEENV